MSFHCRGIFQILWLRIWDGKIIPDCSGSSLTTCVFWNGTRDGSMKRIQHTLADFDEGREDANDASINPWKEAIISPLELSAMDTALLGLGFSPARLGADFWPTKLPDLFYFVKEPSLWWLCRAGEKAAHCPAGSSSQPSLCLPCVVSFTLSVRVLSVLLMCLFSKLSPISLRGVPKSPQLQENCFSSSQPLGLHSHLCILAWLLVARIPTLSLGDFQHVASVWLIHKWHAEMAKQHFQGTDSCVVSFYFPWTMWPLQLLKGIWDVTP